MKRAILVHGWSGSPDEHWFPWLKKELEKMSFQVSAPFMRNHDDPVIEEWVRHLEEVAGDYDEETIFIGHSIGCQAILRFVEKTGRKIKGAIFVAGWFNLKNLEGKEEEKVARPWIERPMDIQKLKGLIQKSVLIISDNDPYDCLEQNKKKFSDLGSKIIELHKAGHFTTDDGFEKLPQIIDELEAIGM